MSDNAESQARAQVASIVAMVAALNVDYGLLEELREERAESAFASSVLAERNKQPGSAVYGNDWWENQYPDEAAELAELESAAGENTSEDEAREAIEQDALSVEVRSDWASSKDEFEAEEFRIVLCTGGPHVELVGDLDRGTPSRIRVLYRDWGTSGEYFPDTKEREALETYCAQLYLGE